MNDKRFIANMNDSSDSIACMKRSRGTRYILHCTMIVTMFNFLKKKNNFYKFDITNTLTQFIIHYYFVFEFDYKKKSLKFLFKHLNDIKVIMCYKYAL